MIALCRSIGVPARLVTGFEIKQELDAKPVVWVEVFIGQSWVPYDPTNGYTRYLLMHYLPVRRGGLQPDAPVWALHATKLTTTYSIVRLDTPEPVLQTGQPHPRQILNLERLPLPMHKVMRVLLLLPFGALITVDHAQCGRHRHVRHLLARPAGDELHLRQLADRRGDSADRHPGRHGGPHVPRTAAAVGRAAVVDHPDHRDPVRRLRHVDLILSGTGDRDRRRAPADGHSDDVDRAVLRDHRGRRTGVHGPARGRHVDGGGARAMPMLAWDERRAVCARLSRGAPVYDCRLHRAGTLRRLPNHRVVAVPRPGPSSEKTSHERAKPPTVGLAPRAANAPACWASTTATWRSSRRAIRAGSIRASTTRRSPRKSAIRTASPCQTPTAIIRRYGDVRRFLAIARRP